MTADPVCKHENVRPGVWDHALVVVCADCDAILGHCWGHAHVSERLWNRACKGHEDDFNPCEQDRPDVCVCGSAMAPAKVTCFWDWCEACGAVVRCGMCGNKCCTGGYGTLADGSACLFCADAYAMQDKRDMPDELRARDAILNMSRIASEQSDRDRNEES